MTLIATYITKHGIIHASDSNLSSSKLGNAGFGQKVFPILHVNAGLSYSGCYTVNGETINKWMNSFIQDSFYSTATIEEFTTQLKERISSEMRDYEKEEITIIHISGFQKIEFKSHFEFWHISNTTLLDNGIYEKAGGFHLNNDFNSTTR